MAGMPRRLCLLTLLAIFFAASFSSIAAGPVASRDGYQVVHPYSHDPKAFTQGLIYVDGHLYESTGLSGRSSLRLVDLETGQVLQKHDVAYEFFGEGLTDWGSTLI